MQGEEMNGIIRRKQGGQGELISPFECSTIVTKHGKVRNLNHGTCINSMIDERSQLINSLRNL